MAAQESVSLVEELRQIEHAADGASVLLDAVRNRRLDDDDANDRAQGAVAAIVGMIVARLGIVRRVLRHEIDPGLLVTNLNGIDVTGHPGDDPDVLLHPWPVADGSQRDGIELVHRGTRQKRPAK